MFTLRTEESEKRYSNRVKKDYCPLCKAKPIYDYGYWRIIDNEYPYDAVSTLNYMLIPKDHISDIPIERIPEAREILKKHQDQFDAILWNFPHRQTVPEHIHFQLLKYKIER